MLHDRKPRVTFRYSMILGCFFPILFASIELRVNHIDKTSNYNGVSECSLMFHRASNLYHVTKLRCKMCGVSENRVGVAQWLACPPLMR